MHLFNIPRNQGEAKSWHLSSLNPVPHCDMIPDTPEYLAPFMKAFLSKIRWQWIALAAGAPVIAILAWNMISHSQKTPFDWVLHSSALHDWFCTGPFLIGIGIFHCLFPVSAFVVMNIFCYEELKESIDKIETEVGKGAMKWTLFRQTLTADKIGLYAFSSIVLLGILIVPITQLDPNQFLNLYAGIFIMLLALFILFVFCASAPKVFAWVKTRPIALKAFNAIKQRSSRERVSLDDLPSHERERIFALAQKFGIDPKNQAFIRAAVGEYNEKKILADKEALSLDAQTVPAPELPVSGRRL